ncbi:MAG: site-specific integrase, partial [Paracoccaceae bacterium]
MGVFADKRLNAWHKMQRQQMYYFVLFLANSGLRVGEAREMLWSDIKFDVAVDASDSAIAEV